MKRSRGYRYWILASLSLLLVMFVTLSPALPPASASPPSPGRIVQGAWQRTIDVGAYHYPLGPKRLDGASADSGHSVAALAAGNIPMAELGESGLDWHRRAPVRLTAVLTVTNANDNGPGSLRQAIADAAPGDTVNFDGDYAIYLASPLAIDKRVTVDGGGHAIQVSGDTGDNGSPDVQVFTIGASGVVTLNHLSIVNGITTGYGGGIYNYQGTLTVQDSTLSGNSAGLGGGGIYNDWGTLTVSDSSLSGNYSGIWGGGGINNFHGTLTVIDSSLSGNYSETDGGGIYNDQGTLTVQNSSLSGNSTNSRGGGISSYTPSGTCAASPQTIIINSTLSGNTASLGGGGVYNFTGVTEIAHSTITTNTAPTSQGGGVRSYNDSNTCTRVGNSIIAGNGGSDVAAAYTGQRFSSWDYNVIGTAGDNVDFGHEFTQTNDLVNVADPGLGPLADNGGPGQATWTHALLPGSPALDRIPSGSNGCGTTYTHDQRGVARPQGAACDVGAYEAAPELSLAKSVTPTTAVPYHGVVTYTILLSNTGLISDAHVILTDTLPAGVDWGQWVERPGGGLVRAGHAITWTGTLSPSTAITFTFTATHTGDYGDVVINTAFFSGTQRKGSDDAAFSVVCENPLTVQNANDAGTGSLRQAIAEACPGGTINFDGDYAIYLASPLAIDKRVTVDGGGHAIQVSGNNAVQVFTIGASGVVTLNHLSIVNGITTGYGGGIYNAGTLTVQDSTLSGNLAGLGGGGIYNDQGTLTVQNSSLSGNSAGEGGGIYNNQGTLTVQDSSSLSDNSAMSGAGGGILNAGTLTVQDSTLSGNLAYVGGGIGNAGTLTVQDSTLSGNLANVGGGIYNYQSMLTVQNSTLSGNSAGYGGGIHNDQGTLMVQNSTLSGNSATNIGGGIHNYLGTLTVHNSTLSGNSATDGGGIYNEFGTLTVQDSRLSGNSANSYGGGISSFTPSGTCAASPQTIIINSTLSGNTASSGGGGVYNFIGVTEIAHSTITTNTAPTDQGGGVLSTNSIGTCTRVGNSIIAGNGGSDVAAVYIFQRFSSWDYNVIGAAGANVDFGQEFNQDNDLVNVANPGLGPLADNGGPSAGPGQATWTHALLPGSPALDHIPSGSNGCGTTYTHDQRGVARPQGAACDVGAYEAAPELSLAKSVTPTTAVPYHGVVTYTILLSNTGLISDAHVILTDTLPAGVDWGQWVERPGGGLVRAGHAITWTGTLTHSTATTFTFTATHTGDYGDVVINTAFFSGTQRKGSDDAVFVVCANALTVQNANDDGPSSLRQAIARVCPGGTINFDGDYAIYLASPLAIDKRVTVDGGGHAIQVSGDTGDDGSPDVQVFTIGASGVVTLNHLSIVSGTASLYGGGIYNAGTLAVQDSSLSGNSANYGGGILNDGTLTVSDSSLSGNSAGEGGGIYNNQGTLTVHNNTLSDNSATNIAGGICNYYGTLTVHNSTLSDNSANNDGGGVFNFAGTLTVQDSSLSGNSASDGGGIYNYYGTLTVHNSSLSGNSANYGGGISSYTPSGTSAAPPQTIITNSTLSGNTASWGGGVFINDGSIDAANVLFAGNQAGGGGAAMQLSGGRLRHVTIAHPTQGSGPAILMTSGTATITDTIIAGYTVGISQTAGTLSADYDLFFTTTPTQTSGGTMNWGSHNLGANPRFVNPAAGDYHLVGGSPAIDAGTNVGVATDLDGIARPQGKGYDIGAYEFRRIVVYLPLALRNTQ